MIAGLLSRIRLPRSRKRPAARRRRATRAGHRSARAARAALLWGVAAFVAMGAVFVVALETVMPEWRDPEFAVRLKQLRRWQEAAPDRPRVLVFGSSRTQMGVDPAAMGFPDVPGSPVVYNCGYRSANPIIVKLHLGRLLEAGVKPAAVLIQLTPSELEPMGPVERQYAAWGPRFSRTDLDRLGGETENPEALERGWRTARLRWWETYKGALRSAYLPSWQTPMQRTDFVWEFTDPHGFAPHPMAVVPDDLRERGVVSARRSQAGGLETFNPSDRMRGVIRDIVGRCRQEGIAVAFFWAPESQSFQKFYSKRCLRRIAAFERALGGEFGSPVFPAPPPGVLAESDFADGIHLLRGGAAKYAAWLADAHLRPWLKSQGLAGE